MACRNPVFSFIIPCFNQSDYLNDCFQAFIDQNFKEWEAILVNDGSTDQTSVMGRAFLKSDPRIRYIEQENQGLSAARNAGIKLAKGEFLLFLDADDWIAANCLTSYVHVIQSNPQVNLFRCGYSYWDMPLGKEYHSHLPSDDGLIYPGVLTQNIGPCHSILIKRDFAEKLGGFDTTLRSCEDWDFWIRAGKMGAKIYSIPDVLVGYRYVPDSMSRNPLVMYEALTEVSRRAGQPDIRLPKEAPFNQVVELDYPSIQKKHLIRMVGVLLHQGKVHQAAEWYLKEKERWSWEETDRDWKGLATYLSWGYFFEPHQIDTLLSKTSGDLAAFFKMLGYSKPKIQLLLRLIFEPQLKRRNHQEYGKLIGGIKNKLGWY